MADTKKVERRTVVGAEDLTQIRGGVCDSMSKDSDLAADTYFDWWMASDRKKATRKKTKDKAATVKDQ
jgi:hypothetical protein